MVSNFKNNKISVISFDLDNALYNNLPVLIKAESISSDYLATEFKRQKRNYSFDNYVAIRQSLLESNDIRFENLSFFRQVALKQLCQGLINAEQIAANAFSLFLEARCQVEIPIEIVTMLASLAKDYTLVSVTNGNCEMQQLSIASYFSKNYSTSANFRAKPHPQMLQQVIQDFNLQPQNLLHVGDSIEKDGGAANNAQVDFFHFAPFIDSTKSIQLECHALLKYLNH